MNSRPQSRRDFRLVISEGAGFIHSRPHQGGASHRSPLVPPARHSLHRRRSRARGLTRQGDRRDYRLLRCVARLLRNRLVCW